MRKVLKEALGKLGLLEVTKPLCFYFSYRRKFFSKLIKREDLCFDVGANVGYYTDLFLRLGATVVAIEPQNENMQILQKKFGDNRKVKLIGKGLDERGGQRELLICDTSSDTSSMSQKWISVVRESGRLLKNTWDRTQQVDVTTLDLLIQEYGVPAFMKIDVEGFEFNVLKGLSVPIDLISFEFTPEYLEPTHRCISYLNELGKVKFNYSIDPRGFALSDWVSGEDIAIHLSKLFIYNYPGPNGDIYAKFQLD